MTNKNNWKQDFYNSIKEIDGIYNETIEKLEELHKRKMDLIKKHKENLNKESLDQLRHEIKEADNN